MDVQKIPVKTFVLPAIALLCFGAWIIGAWLLLPRMTPDPATMLPSERTIALVRNISRQQAKNLQRTIVEFAQFPTTTDIVTAALLRKDDGTLTWVTQGKDRAFHTTDVVVAAMLKQQPIAQPLDASPVYRTLTDGCAQTCIFLRFPELQISTGSPLHPWMNPTQPIAISMNGSDIDIRMPTTATSEQLTYLAAYPQDIFDHPIAVLHASNLSALYATASEQIKKETRLVTETLVRHIIVRLFGEDMSPRFDIAPLLGSQNSLQIAEGTNQHLRFILSGIMGSSAGSLQQLMDTYRSRLASATIEQRTFDNKFTMDVVRQNTQNVTSTNDTLHGWTTRVVTDKVGNRSLYLAMRGGKYVLSNDEQAWNKALTSVPESFAGPDAAPVALGMFDSRDTATLLSKEIPTLFTARGLPSGTGGMLLWKLSHESDRLSLLLQRM